LEAAAHLQDGFGVPVADEISFCLQERVGQHDDHEVVRDRGACSGWSSTRVLAHQPND
jgi:hypothetical protein